MPRRRPPTKPKGDWVECEFMASATRRGLTVSKPYGDSTRYDFMVDAGVKSGQAGRISRVQVKSVSVLDQDSYRLTLSRGGGSKTGYRCCEIDFLAGYVIPQDVWYIIPVRAVARLKSIRLCPHRPSRRRLELYREAWRLLR